MQKLNLMGYLLSFPNSSPNTLPVFRSEFYKFKDQLLDKHAMIDGQDLQEIIKYCYACRGTGTFVYYNGKKAPCRRCTSGIYDRFFVILTRYKLGEWLFHVPLERSGFKPKGEFKNRIQGYIHHQKYSNKTIVAAYLLLTLLCSQRLFWYSIYKLISRPFTKLTRMINWKFTDLRTGLKQRKRLVNCKYIALRTGLKRRLAFLAGDDFIEDDIPF